MKLSHLIITELSTQGDHLISGIPFSSIPFLCQTTQSPHHRITTSYVKKVFIPSFESSPGLVVMSALFLPPPERAHASTSVWFSREISWGKVRDVHQYHHRRVMIS